MFHIDHYLGKEMVRNMQAIRFMNPIFQDVWNAKYIEHVQISAMETVGVENRGGYYDQSGALKDMVQNQDVYKRQVSYCGLCRSFAGCWRCTYRES